jgi:hypothetical protein
MNTLALSEPGSGGDLGKKAAHLSQRSSERQRPAPVAPDSQRFYAARTCLPSAARAAARSVLSQVNSGSVRPKCP